MTFHAPPALGMLDRLRPMHVVVSESGHIEHVGPTMLKLRPGRPWVGRRFLEVLRVVRPRDAHSIADLHRVAGRKLHLELREAPRTALKGILVPRQDGCGLVADFSFGIGVADAVRDYNLNVEDFAPTDLTVEMLYLIEAQSAAMEASRNLNARLQGAKVAAERQAVTDPLTGLDNRRVMDMALARLIALRRPIAVMRVDFDYFKSVNDTLGHAAGDFILKDAARVFADLTRRVDIVARVGGDEFVVICPELTEAAPLEALGARLIAEIEQPRVFHGTRCRISCSIGTATWNAQRDITPDALLDEADLALYASKNRGRGRHTLFTPDLREAARTLPDARPRSEFRN